MKKLQQLLILFLSALIPTISMTAQSRSWSGDGELGFFQTNGNTNIEYLFTRSKFSMTHTNVWQHSIGLELDETRNNGKKISTGQIIQWQTDRKFSKKFSSFVKIRDYQNTFQNINTRLTMVVGGSLQAIDNAFEKAKVDLGFGTQSVNYKEGSNTKGDSAYLIGAKYSYRILRDITFYEDFLYITAKSTFYESISAFAISFTSALSIRVGYLIRNTDSLSSPYKKSDSEMRLSLLYSFQ